MLMSNDCTFQLQVLPIISGCNAHVEWFYLSADEGIILLFLHLFFLGFLVLPGLTTYTS
jgi:hypothetical protein